MTTPDIVLSIITQQLSHWEEYLDDVRVIQIAHNLNFLLCISHLALSLAGNLFERIEDVSPFVDNLEDLSEFAISYEIQNLVLSVKFLEGGWCMTFHGWRLRFRTSYYITHI